LVLAALLLTATVLPACGGSSASASPTFTASEYKFGGPSTIKGGVIDLTVRNEGKLKHEAALVRVGNTPRAQVLKDLDGVVQGGPMPDYFGIGGGVAAITANTTGATKFAVKPGKYLLVCTYTDADSQEGGGGPGSENLPKHYNQGMVKAITVEGENSVALPEGTSITARDYTFDTSGLKAGDNTVTFTNKGPAQIHHVVVNEFPAGVDEAGATKALQAFFSTPEGQAPPAGTPEPKDVGEAPPYDPGLGGTFTVKLQAGRTYALMCFISDRTGGPPHAIAHNMVKTFTIK
jgi:uncharacterized cupredoxin-like copper-binding protein